MNWTELIERVAERTGLPQAQVKETLDTLTEVVLASIRDGEDVRLRGLCTLSLRWQEGRQLRSVADHRRIVLDGRWVPRLRPAASVREVALARSPQRWRDPRQQSAWQLAETLIGDLDLYHRGRAPLVSRDAPLPEVADACREAFGTDWARVMTTWEAQVPVDVRAEGDHLLRTARVRWSVTTH